MFNKEKRYIEINRTGEKPVFEIITSQTKRKWMNETAGNAYRCIPLNVANQYGWTVLSPTEFTVEWNGGESRESMRVSFEETPPHNIASSEFGHGILSIVPDFVIRTNENVSIYVRGVPNQIASGLQPLDAIVETDWLPFTFTFNYKFVKPGKLTIKKDQPLFTFFPIERNYIETFEARETHIENDKEFFEDYMSYSKLRLAQNNGKVDPKTTGGTYSKGRLLKKEYDILNHQKTLNLPEFKST